MRGREGEGEGEGGREGVRGDERGGRGIAASVMYFTHFFYILFFLLNFRILEVARERSSSTIRREEEARRGFQFFLSFGYLSFSFLFPLSSFLFPLSSSSSFYFFLLTLL